MNKYIGGAAATLVIIGAGFATVPGTFAATQARQGLGKGPNKSPGQNNHDGNLPGSDHYFLLTHYAAQSVKGRGRTYDVTVTVEQLQFDGNDKTNNETHYFPTSVSVSWGHGNKTTATLQGSPPGINYTNTTSGDKSATAEYQFTLPPGATLTRGTQLSIGPFYMVGPVQMHSPDDVVYDSPITIPYGQLPEVPWAGALPVVGVGLGTAIWLRKRRTSTTV